MNREVDSLAVLNAQRITQAGIAPVFAAADAAGDEFPNTGRTLFHVKNGGSTDVTVTFDSVKKCDQGFDHDIQVVVPAGAERMIGPFEPGRFNNSAGRVLVSYSDVASVTVAALEV